MAKVVVIEWDEAQLKIVVAERRADRVLVEHVGHVVLERDKSVGAQIGDELKRLGASRGEVIVSVPRSRAEIRTLKVPPAPDSELPDLVRFQAVRQFPSIGEDWIVDFVKLSVGDDNGQSILTTAASPQLLKEIRQTCEDAGITPKAAILRPYGKAGLIQTECPTSGCVLVAEPCSHAIDLTILIDSQVAYLRSIPRSDDPSLSLNDIRRTISAVPMQLSGQKVEKVLVLANDGDPLIAILDEALDMDVRAHNPLGKHSQAKRPVSDPTGSYSALIGLAMLDLTDANVIDLLNPTQPPVDHSVKRKGILVAALAVVAILGLTAFVYLSLSRMSQQIVDLKTKEKALKKLEGRWDATEKQLAALEQFENGNVIWLNELHELSLELPGPEATYVQQMTMLTKAGNGGIISFKAVANEHATIEAIEHALRDERHKIRGKGGTETPKAKAYPWSYEEVVEVGIKDTPEDASAEDEKPTVAKDVEIHTGETLSGETLSGETLSGETLSGEGEQS
ncbi:MAG: hypothetical protein ACI9HK_005088 [Pirellulaceae bacterium]|jgi:hypothetical protein